jgi:hypothetical protein
MTPLLKPSLRADGRRGLGCPDDRPDLALLHIVDELGGTTSPMGNSFPGASLGLSVCIKAESFRAVGRIWRFPPHASLRMASTVSWFSPHNLATQRLERPCHGSSVRMRRAAAFFSAMVNG